MGEGTVDEWNAMWGDGADPTPFIPYLGCFPLHFDRRVDWGLRLAATFSQKAREIQYWEWMATSCCQCCNLGNRQSTILVPSLATGTVGKMDWIVSAYGLYCSHTKKVYMLYIIAMSRIYCYHTSQSIPPYYIYSGIRAHMTRQTMVIVLKCTLTSCYHTVIKH